MLVFQIALVFAVLSLALGFSPSRAKFGQQVTVSKTQVFEDFNLDFLKPDFEPKITSDKLIFSERQLREWTQTYSDDTRVGLLDGVINFVKGIFSKEEVVEEEDMSMAKALKPTVSIAVLEEKTALFVKGKIDNKSYYTVLKGAFGDKLPGVLPQIIANLPTKKAQELSKIAK